MKFQEVKICRSTYYGNRSDDLIHGYVLSIDGEVYDYYYAGNEEDIQFTRLETPAYFKDDTKDGIKYMRNPNRQMYQLHVTMPLNETNPGQTIKQFFNLLMLQ